MDLVIFLGSLVLTIYCFNKIKKDKEKLGKTKVRWLIVCMVVLIVQMLMTIIYPLIHGK